MRITLGGAAVSAALLSSLAVPVTGKGEDTSNAARAALYRQAGLYECPELCSVAGSNPSNWTRFASNNDLEWCKNSTMLMNLPLRTPLSNDDSHSVFYACLSSRGDEVKSRVANVASSDDKNKEFRTAETVQLIESNKQSTIAHLADSASSAIQELQAAYLDVPTGNTNQTSYFAKRGDAIVGVYVGGNVKKQNIAATLLQKIHDRVASGEVLGETTLLQVCGDKRSSDSVAGVVIQGAAGLDSVYTAQEIVKTWANAKCVTDIDGNVKSEPMRISYNAAFYTNRAGDANDTTVATPDDDAVVEESGLDRRADCKTVQTKSGDGCESLAKKCNITPAAFTKLHPQSTFCSSLKIGQWVCCTTGTLPDLKPKPNPDGSCATYTVKNNDDCSQIAASHSLAVDDITKLNQDTWGFAGCSSLWPDMTLCLSSGKPPMPAPVSDAVCGPQVPGTKKPSSTAGDVLAKLNPCPLNACCNVWGKCGTTEDFCVEASLGPPGTSKPGKNGCISSCGMDIVNNDEGPASPMTVGYFEAWNYDRNCLHMDVTQMSKSITHIHFAFVDVTAGFSVSIDPKVKGQWDNFKKMSSSHHKIAAFGGWAASTESTSYYIFREGVKPENRDKLATNLAKFIT